jgi:hypothetical protein
MTGEEDTIVTVDFIDAKDLASEMYRLAYGHGACHVGLCIGDAYLYPTATGRLKIRPSGVIYYHFHVVQSISLLGRATSSNWIEQFVGRKIDSQFYRLLTEPIYVLKDTGLKVKVPKREICVDIVADALKAIGIHTYSRTPDAFFKELQVHTHRIG